MTTGSAASLPVLSLDPIQYPGGVALWGSLPAVYDTTRNPPEHGVHVHARRVANRKKEIDGSYGRVDVALSAGQFSIHEADATPFVAGAVLGLPLSTIACPFCSTKHLDEGRFAVHPHQHHLCLACNREFLEPRRAIGNPVLAIKHAMGDPHLSRPTTAVTRPLRLSQSDAHCSGGILIWGTNPAILWTAPRQEESGIHVHTYSAGVDVPVVDNTYGSVEIDGVSLDPAMVRVFMVQQSLSHLRGAIQHLQCSKCGRSHFDDAVPFAVEPHRNHTCTGCGNVFCSPSAAISNPLVDSLMTLYAHAAKAGRRKNPLAP